jgi:transposase
VKGGGVKATDLTPLTVPEVRRLLLAQAASPERQRHLLAWSHFRRRHQAHAGRAHTTRRAHAHALAGLPPAAPGELPGSPALLLVGTAPLTDAAWGQIAPLLPPLQVAPKRTRYDHRRVLEGILRVMRRGQTWREGPAADVPWPVLYQRYSLWRRRGIWEAILHILHPESDSLFVT